MVQIVVASASGETHEITKKKQRRGKRKTTSNKPQISVDSNTVEIGSAKDPEHLQEQIIDDKFLVQEDQLAQEQAYIGHVPAETLEYFKTVEPMISRGSLAKLDAEEQALLIQNIYTEVDGKELLLATEATCSRILENLITASDSFAVRVLMDRFAGSYFDLFTHRFGSHVIQSLLKASAVCMASEMDLEIFAEVKEGALLSNRQLFVNICKELKSKWTTLMMDPYGSHLLRIILEILSGGKSGQSLVRSKASQKYHTGHDLKNAEINVRPVFPEYTEELESISQQLTDKLTDVELRTLTCHAVANPVLQTLLTINREDEASTDQLVNRLLMDLRSESNDSNAARNSYVLALLKSRVGSHLMELILDVCSIDMRGLIVEKVLCGNMDDLVFDPVANYVIQKLLLLSLPRSAIVVLIDEMSPLMANMLFRQRANIVINLLQVIRKQNFGFEIVDTLQSAFKATTEAHDKQYLQYFLCLQTASDYDQRPGKFQVAGSRLLQEFLKLPSERIAFMVGSFLVQPTATHKQLATDQIASHAYGAFMTSTTIDKRVKKRLVKAMAGTIALLAADKCGSHFVDQCWAAVDVECKQEIGDELLSSYQDLLSKPSGRIILRNLNIELMKRNRAEWVHRLEGVEKKRSMFSGFFSQGKLATTSVVKTAGFTSKK